jgi:branched-chain amino acid aminotransferase
MIACVQGRFVPAERATVSAFDRGFLYGDGVFETLRIRDGQPLQWSAHYARLQRGAALLGIHLPFDEAALAACVARLVLRNRLREASVRITVSRGRGPRGYSPRGADTPTWTLSAHTLPDLAAIRRRGWALRTSSLRLAAGDPLAAIKSCNKLVNVLARAEAEAAGADEALLLNGRGHVVEAASASIFWAERDSLVTPPLTAGALEGVTRATVLELCRELRIPVRIRCAGLARLARSDGAFVALSTLGLVPVRAVDGRRLPRTALWRRLSAAYRARR